MSALSAALHRAHQLDLAIYGAVARASTPRLDRVLARLSEAANYSRLSLLAAAVLAAGGGPRGRCAARNGLASVAVTAAVVNVVMKPLSRRRRPERSEHEVPGERHVAMPASRSFPSGHSAAAFAFAAGAGRELPEARPPLRALAAAVAYSRLHTGVHYPSDVLVGSLTGLALAALTGRWLDARS
jgi:membrane-associated phospholipid phosphatase